MTEHILYQRGDFSHMSGEEQHNSALVRNVIEGGLAICKVCGAGESQLDDFPTCEDYQAEKERIRHENSNS